MSLAVHERGAAADPAEPLVTVVIPCFNQGEYLAEALESVRRQTFRDWECIVVDDGSTDTTAQVGQEFARRDARIRYVYQRNGGLASARNRGLELARTAYLQFLDADDLLHASKLELQLAALGGAPGNALCFCDYRFGCGEGAATTLERRDLGRPTFKHHSPLEELIDRWESELSIPVHAFLFDRRLFEAPAVRFDETIPNHEDWDCWLQLFKREVYIVHVAQELATYRIRPGSMSSNEWAMWKGIERVCRKHIALHPHEPLIVEALRRKMRRMRRLYRNRMLDGLVGRLPPGLYDAYRRWMPTGVQRFIRRRHVVW
jgi:glycosyltransferase involved in cell wall biosynthesis